MTNLNHHSISYFALVAVTALVNVVLPGSPALADTALHNINGYTSTNEGIRSFSVLVFDDSGRIVATGAEELLTSYPSAKRMDGDSRTVLPGLTDAHAHVFGLGLLQSQLNLMGVPSVEKSVNEIERYAASDPGSRWILGRGWNQVLWPVQEFPTAGHIDAVVSDRPVWLRRIDGHAGWANSAAMRLAGVDDDTPDPIGGKILRDANGHATGVFIDNAMDFVGSQVPGHDVGDVHGAIQVAVRTLVSEGITSVHDAGINLMTAEVYLSMADNNQLDMRIYAMIGGAGDVLDAIGQPIKQYGNDRLEIAAVKLVADGALGSRGAAMIEPYSDDTENRGLPFWTQQELNEQVSKASSMGFQVGIHAIGDMGNHLALNAFDRTQGGEPSTMRNRIEHAQIISPDDIPRFAELGVIASIQATHATSDKNMAEDRIGAERMRGSYAWRRLLDSGAVIANGSDFPVELSNPFHGLYAAVTRQGRDGSPEGGWYADQALTRAEALHSFTLAAAYAANQEKRLGSLEAGKWADFIVIDRDYFEIPSSEIDDIKVLQTWVAGKPVYAMPDAGEAE
jgi:predicted amidohydrolase YtcJ